MNESELVLIDLSSIAYPIYLMSSADPNPNHTSQQIVARVRALATGHKHVAVCCDSGRSFRHDISPEYKANRPEREAALHHQIGLAKEALAGDGFPVWAVPGFEADDIIATATMKALATEDLTVLLVTGDKDLLQLVGPRVRFQKAADGTVMDTEAIIAKFEVRPDQIRDWLTLAGDSADNIKGATDIGPKTAAKLLAKFGTIDEIYRQLVEAPARMGIPPAKVASLRAFQPSFLATRALVTLRSDVEIPFHEIVNERVPKAVADFGVDAFDEEELESAEQAPVAMASTPVPAVGSTPAVATDPAPAHQAEPEPSSEPRATPNTGLAIREPEVLAPAPAEWERQLDPRSMSDARSLAKDLFQSTMFSAYGTPQAVLSTIMLGRELGLPAMGSLRSVHIIEGKHSLSASIMAALVLRSGLAEYFEPISFSETEATYETKRKGARNPVRLTHTIEMARQAWPKTKADWEKAFLASGWGRNPTDMLVARTQARLARMVYPDLLAGIYDPDELREIREQGRAA